MTASHSPSKMSGNDQLPSFRESPGRCLATLRPIVVSIDCTDVVPVAAAVTAIRSRTICVRSVRGRSASSPRRRRESSARAAAGLAEAHDHDAEARRVFPMMPAGEFARARGRDEQQRAEDDGPHRAGGALTVACVGIVRHSAALWAWQCVASRIPGATAGLGVRSLEHGGGGTAASTRGPAAATTRLGGVQLVTRRSSLLGVGRFGLEINAEPEVCVPGFE